MENPKPVMFRSTLALILATALPAAADLTITNGNFEGSAFRTSTQTGNSPRDFFYRAQWAAGGDGWYNSNNPQNWDPIAGGPSGSGNYGAKDASANNRGVVNVITDNRQTKGLATLGMKVLHRPNGGTENFIVKVWGVRESVPGQWDGWIDLTGPSGNANALDVRNFNNALAPDNAGQTQSATVVSYTGTDFTPLLSRTAAAFGLTPSENWQDLSFSVDLGQTGYDQIIVGVSFYSTSGTRSGIDDLVVLPNPPQPQLVATPPTLTPADQQITLNWSTLTFPANASVVITSNRSGIGPFDVTSSTDANGSSTQPLTIPYTHAIGDVTFTITVTDLASGKSGESNLTVQAPSNSLPNVLVVLVDDMGWADISPYGGEIRTPTLQRLADNGIRFRAFHNEARCAPTRNALLTGLHVQTAATDPNHNLPPIRIDNNVTIAEMLRSVGYRTYHSGKWHLSEYVNQANYTPLSSPTNRGFNYAFNASLWGGNLADHHGLGTYWNGQDFTLYPPNAEIVPIRYDGTDTRASRVPFFKTDADADYVIEYLNHHFAKNDGKPFMVYWADNAPHFDLSAPKERINLYTDIADPNPGDEDIYRYEDGWDLTRQRRYERQLAQGIIPAGTRLPPLSPDHGGPAIPAWSSITQVEHDDLSRRMATYAAMVHGIDENLGRIVARLEQAGQLDNTIILFMSDNGGNAEGGIFGGGTRRTGTELTEMGQNGRAGMNLGGAWANVNNTPFRYFKHDTFEGGCRTPCIVHWPAGIRPELAGTWTEQRGHMIDIMPTLLEIAGIRYPQKFAGHNVAPVQGISLLPALNGQALPDRDLTIEHERNRALYRGDWKLVTKNFSFAGIEELPAHTVELYNLRNDPTEMNNLATHQPPMLASMVNAFNAWVNNTPGLDANRLIAAVPTEATSFVMPRGKELLVDLFNRPDAEDLDADQTGISGTLIGMNAQPVGDAHYEGFNGAGADIANKKLRLSGMVENGLKVNLDSPLVLTGGGFSVAIDIDSIVTATATTDDYVGLGIGLTEEAAQAGGDITTATSFRGNAAQQQGLADFFAELDANGNVKLWKHGVLQNTIPVGATNGKLLAVFETSGFTAGAEVQAKVFFNHKPIYSGSFTWRQAGASRAGISARTSDHVDLDNLVLSPLPMADAFVGSYTTSFGLADAQSGPEQDPDGDGVTNEEEWMLGSNPALADDPLTNALEVRHDDPARIALLHRRVMGHEEAGASYRILCSPDLSAWTELTPEQKEVIATSGNYDEVSLTLPEPLRSEKRLFFKLVL